MITATNIKNFCWAVIVGGITIMVTLQTGLYAGPEATSSEITVMAVFSPQKILFNDMLYFAGLLYLNGKDFQNPLLRVRLGVSKRFIMRLVRQGITLIIVYSAFLTLTLELGLRLQNMSGEYDLHIWIHIGLLAWLWYNIYLISYLISKNHIIGTMILISTQLGYLVSGMMMQFVGGVNLFNVIFDWKLVLAVNIGLGLIVLGITERKEWIK